MKRSSNLSQFDVTERQRKTLQYVLEEAEVLKKQGASGAKVSIAEARGGAAHYTDDSNRQTTRLLFISQDVSLLNQTTQSLDGYLNLHDVFDEVHILVLQVGLPARNPVLRVADNVWLYTVSSKAGLSQFQAAKQMIVDQLVFADGFRADLVVARDPLMSGQLALWVSRTYERPAQLHVLEDFTERKLFARYAYPKLTQFWSRYVIKRFLSIRTSTDSVCEKLLRLYPHIRDIKTLPRFHNVAEIAHSSQYFNIKDKYQQFSFIILYIGALTHESKAFQAIDAARNLMRNQRVGLVVVGDGDAAEELKTRATVLGIPTQVVFERSPVDLYSYLKSADVLLIPDADELSDELAIQGGVAGIPIVMVPTEKRRDLFEDSVSALFCVPDDNIDMSNQIKKILNDLGLRAQLKFASQQRVTEKLHEDPETYRLMFRDSIEAALFPEDSESSAE